jgi:hypothetical protein
VNADYKLKADDEVKADDETGGGGTLTSRGVDRWHENRQELIAITAYYLAEGRGFAPGHELEDWLEAEFLVDHRLMGEGRAF